MIVVHNSDERPDTTNKLLNLQPMRPSGESGTEHSVTYVKNVRNSSTAQPDQMGEEKTWYDGVPIKKGVTTKMLS